MPNKQLRLNEEEIKVIKKLRSKEERRVLVLPDLHAPFITPGFLEHCKDIYSKYNCNAVHMTGDLLDNSFSSFHEIAPDGLSAGDELKYAIEQIRPFWEAFPVATVCIGNHDAIISRKLVASGLSEAWLKDFNEVLGTPGWIWSDSFDIDGVKYLHGTGSSGRNGAINRAINWNTNLVQGHIHTETSIIYHANNDRLIWSMQLGAAFNVNSYAAAYAKNFTKKPIISVGVILENGTLPILEPMRL
tara:strand:+ start:7235 stop:7969 length:735 start_codon:yes stop_codon:yes gene_type:complete